MSGAFLPRISRIIAGGGERLASVNRNGRGGRRRPLSEPPSRVELETYHLRSGCSAIELRWRLVKRGEVYHDPGRSGSGIRAGCARASCRPQLAPMKRRERNATPCAGQLADIRVIGLCGKNVLTGRACAFTQRQGNLVWLSRTRSVGRYAVALAPGCTSAPSLRFRRCSTCVSIPPRVRGPRAHPGSGRSRGAGSRLANHSSAALTSSGSPIRPTLSSAWKTVLDFGFGTR